MTETGPKETPRPKVSEVNSTKDRVLVRFVASGTSGSFYGTCLHALRGGEWGCYTIKPSAAQSISCAERGLAKRDWKDWD